MNQLQRIIKATYGLSLMEARQLIIGVLLPRLFFGSIVWFTSKNAKTTGTWLEKLNNDAVRLITGMMRQTPILFLKKDGGLPTLTQYHVKLTHCYIHHRLAAHDSHPVK
ncbi:hypothetical protein O181_065308 [Austropuccinia psidii MF-1]|uniref:Uncharacterized protein n=1 Tax=Austropuccinia psidii MF-1 TaxID=1389203 RepID=A0A9Q3I2G6_9BASI|nr:hypothetical protein [Austropuccinia psidii MF-1]